MKLKLGHNKVVRYFTPAAISMLLISCIGAPSLENTEQLQSVDEQSLPMLTQVLQQEAEKLAVQQHALRESLEQVKPPVETLEPLAPQFDPLEAVNVTIDTDDGDAQMVLRAIAEQSEMNLILSPELSRLKRTISMHLKDVPARIVLDQTLSQLDLYGEVQGNILMVRPFQEKIFDLNFLQTTVTVDFTAGGDVFGANNISGGGGGGGGGGGNGGNILRGDFTLTGTSGQSDDPYEQLAEMLDTIIGKRRGSESAASNKGNVISSKEPDPGGRPLYSLNRMTGTLMVRGKPSQVNAVTRLVTRYQKILDRQILIEAQILDVSLSDNHQYGVDWSLLRRHVASSYTGSGGQQVGGVNGSIPGGVSPPRTVTFPAISSDATGRSFGFAYASNSFDAALNLLREFGTVRMLSNPSLRVKNGQPALINVGTNTRFVSQSAVTINNLGGSATTTANVVTDSVFDGVMVGVIPFIADHGLVNLTIHPIQTEVDQASLALQDVGEGNRISLPVVDFKGMTTSLSLHDGDTVMLGGLIDEQSGSRGDGLPLLSKIPGLGYLFGSRREQSRSRELVIVLSVHVL